MVLLVKVACLECTYAGPLVTILGTHSGEAEAVVASDIKHWNREPDGRLWARDANEQLEIIPIPKGA